MSEYIDFDDPDAVDKLMGLIERAKDIKPEEVHPWLGMIVCSVTNCLCTAMVESVNGDMVVLNFGWDSPKNRFWPCSREHLSTHYRVL